MSHFFVAFAGPFVGLLLFGAQVFAQNRELRFPVSGIRMPVSVAPWKAVEFEHGQAATELVERNKASEAIRVVTAKFSDSSRVCSDEMFLLKRSGHKIRNMKIEAKTSVNCSYETTIADRSTLVAILDTKNKCSDNFIQAIKSTQGLPALIDAVKDPLAEKKALVEHLNVEIARTLSDPAYAAANANIGGMDQAYIDYLLQRRAETTRSINSQAMDRRFIEREREREKLVTMTMNLVSVTGSTFSDSTSDCAKNVGGRYAPQILSVGLGAVSAAGSMVASTVGSGVTIGTYLLSQLVDMFSRLPEPRFREFQQDSQTLDLACLYLSVIEMSCSMKDGRSKGARAAAKSEAAKIPQAKLYSDILAASESVERLDSLIGAVISQDLAIVGGETTSSDISKTYDELADGGGSVATANEVLDGLERQKNLFRLVKKYYVDNLALLGQLKDDSDKTKIRKLTSVVVRNQYDSLENENIPTRDASGREMPAVELFKSHHAIIGRSIDNKIAKQTGKKGEERNYRDLLTLHRAINKREALLNVRFALRTATEMDKFIRESGRSTSIDGLSMISLNDSQRSLLNALAEWIEVDQSRADYQKTLSAAAVKIRSVIGASDEASYLLRERSLRVLNGPYQKFQQISEAKSEGGSTDLFSGPLDRDTQPLSDYAKVKALREIHIQMSDPTIRLPDEDLITRTRTLFEAKSTALRTYFEDGVGSWVDRISKSSNPEVTRRMASQLCGLAYALPASGSDHSISQCASLLPAGMNAHMKGGRQVPECSYVNYLRQQVREESFSTGKPTTLSSGVVQ